MNRSIYDTDGFGYVLLFLMFVVVIGAGYDVWYGNMARGSYEGLACAGVIWAVAAVIAVCSTIVSTIKHLSRPATGGVLLAAFLCVLLLIQIPYAALFAAKSLWSLFGAGVLATVMLVTSFSCIGNVVSALTKRRDAGSTT